MAISVCMQSCYLVTQRANENKSVEYSGNIGNQINLWFSELINNASHDSLELPQDLKPILVNRIKKFGQLSEHLNYLAANVPDEVVETMLENLKPLTPISVYSWDIKEQQEKGEKVWIYAKPFLNIVISQLLKDFGFNEKDYVDNPIIHFRCSDTPFVKHKDYQLMPYSYFDWVIAESEPFHDKDWLLITSCGHLVPSQKKQLWCSACRCYAEDLIDYFGKKNIKVEKAQPAGIIQDIARIFFSPLAVSASPSSFSFVPGVTSNRPYLMPVVGYQNKHVIPNTKIKTITALVQHDEVNWEICEDTLKKLKER